MINILPTIEWKIIKDLFSQSIEKFMTMISLTDTNFEICIITESLEIYMQLNGKLPTIFSIRVPKNL